MLEPNKNGRLELTWFSVPTTSGTVIVIWRDAKSNTSGMTALGCLDICPMCKEQKWDFFLLLWYMGPPSLGLDLKDSALLGLEAC